MARSSKEDALKMYHNLLDSAELLFLKKGVDKTSLDDIAKAAGATRGAVYHHFKNKQALFSAMHERVKLPIDELYEKALSDGDAISALKETFTYCLKTLAKDKRMQRVFTILTFNAEQAQRMECKREESIEKFTLIFKEAAKSGQLAAGLTPSAAAISFHGFITGIFNDYLRNPKAYDLEKLAPELVKVAFRGVLADQGLI